ncbi:phage baseplate assembly protein V [Helicobacter sp. UBA3407]|uniref:phage baseplate assembly protein V n=1 Tax=Helicobacter TaxID=209 RepID=UPI0026173AE7|nr:phage baseplate assembly protein V [Helicobacter sp. UBA3407]
MEEILQTLKNLIAVGTICETKSEESKALARVNLCGRVSDFLPILSFANSYKRHFIPARIGEQVLVLSPYGETNGGIILRGIFNQECKENEGANDTKEILTYEDGVSFSYDSKTSTLKVDSPKQINISCQNASITAQKVEIDSPSIDLGLGGAGVVTTECTCAFTGSPHPHGSANTRSKV